MPAKPWFAKQPRAQRGEPFKTKFIERMRLNKRIRIGGYNDNPDYGAVEWFIEKPKDGEFALNFRAWRRVDEQVLQISVVGTALWGWEQWNWEMNKATRRLEGPPPRPVPRPPALQVGNPAKAEAPKPKSKDDTPLE